MDDKFKLLIDEKIESYKRVMDLGEDNEWSKTRHLINIFETHYNELNKIYVEYFKNSDLHLFNENDKYIKSSLISLFRYAIK